MSTAATTLLAAFDNLPPEERQQVAAEILRRSTAIGELPDEGFIELAADLFRAYDTEEAGRAAG